MNLKFTKTFLFLTLIGLCIKLNLEAQSHNDAWFRATFCTEINSKIKLDNEFQHRRQNGFENKNWFDKNSLFSYRIWLHYQQNKNVKFSVSPFAFYSSYKTIQKKADEAVKPSQEIRFTTAVELQQAISNELSIVNRSAIEYRIFQNNARDIIRFRTRFGIKYGIFRKASIILSNEVFLNAVGANPTHFLDQNRLGLSLEYKLLPNIKLDFGYIYSTKITEASINNLKEHILLLNLSYTLHRMVNK